MDKDCQFYNIGYQVFKASHDLWSKDIRVPFENYFLRELSKFQGRKNINRLEDYHKAFKSESSLKHHEFIKKISRTLPKNIINLNSDYLEFIKLKASILVNKKVEISEDLIEFRVVRPHTKDNNNLHRDHWFPHFYSLINIYLPIAGSEFRSVLRVIPKSHLWKEEEVIPTFKAGQGKKTVNEDGIKYSTPNIKYCKYDLKEHRPDVLQGDFMLFSPLTIHGGGSNATNKTRFSLEIRSKII